MRSILKVVAVITSALAMLTTSLSADESKIPEPFRGEKRGSNIEISYADWSAILKQTVLETGMSDRRAAKAQKTSVGTRVKSGNQSSTRNEGNRIILPAFAKVEENIAYVRKIHKELQEVPSLVPMQEWTKNEQLAYWLNIYNMTMVLELAEAYPIRSMKKLTKGSKKKPSLWNKKLLSIAGVELSLNDIQHTILAEKWNTTTLPMYGLWQGYVGGPNIRDEAYTADTVRKMLLENAREFVNSNRGMKVSGKTLQISTYYKANNYRFPNWKEDLKKHFINLSEFEMRSQIAGTSKIKASTTDYYVADLMGGQKDRSSSAATNEAALDDMHVDLNAGVPDDVRGLSNMSFASYSDFSKAADIPRLPNHVLEFIEKSRKRKAEQEGKVGVEEVENPNNNN